MLFFVFLESSDGNFLTCLQENAFVNNYPNVI